MLHFLKTQKLTYKFCSLQRASAIRLSSGPSLTNIVVGFPLNDTEASIAVVKGTEQPNSDVGLFESIICDWVDVAFVELREGVHNGPVQCRRCNAVQDDRHHVEAHDPPSERVPLPEAALLAALPAAAADAYELAPEPVPAIPEPLTQRYWSRVVTFYRLVSNFYLPCRLLELIHQLYNVPISTPLVSSGIRNNRHSACIGSTPLQVQTHPVKSRDTHVQEVGPYHVINFSRVFPNSIDGAVPSLAGPGLPALFSKWSDLRCFKLCTYLFGVVLIPSVVTKQFPNVHLGCKRW